MVFSQHLVDSIRIWQYNILYKLINSHRESKMFTMIFRVLRAFLIGFITVFAAKWLYYAVRDRGNQ